MLFTEKNIFNTYIHQKLFSSNNFANVSLKNIGHTLLWPYFLVLNKFTYEINMTQLKIISSRNFTCSYELNDDRQLKLYRKKVYN